MKILHTIPSMGILSGGPALSTWLTVQGEQILGVDSQILTFEVSSSNDTNITIAPYIHFIPSPQGNKFKYSSKYRKELYNSDADLLHIQGVWQYPTLSSFICAKKKHKPYIITLRGMLYPQAFEKSFLIKKIVYGLYLKTCLQYASCLHATCMEEMEHLRNMGIHSPIAVIPNPIQIVNQENSVVSHKKIRFGYLGRIYPRKRVERLLYVKKKLECLNFELIIIGDKDPVYMQYLKDETNRLQLNDVIFTGFLTGEKKEEMLNSLSFLIVPSDFENFGNIVTEALVRRIPVIASKGTPWQELNTFHCGWWVDNDVDTLVSTVRLALDTPEEERLAMGERGKQLIKSNYSIEIVANKMKRLYEWILYGGEKPEFVYTK